MKKIKIILTLLLGAVMLSSCGSTKKTSDSSDGGAKAKEFSDLHYQDDVVKKKIPLSALQSAQYQLSSKIVYTSSQSDISAYTNEAGEIVLLDKTKSYQLIYDEKLMGTYDHKLNTGNTSSQSFFVRFSTNINAPSLKMVSNGGLYFPQKSFDWNGRRWTANSNDGVNLMVKLKPDGAPEIIPIKPDGSSLGSGSGGTYESGGGYSLEDSGVKPPSTQTPPSNSQPQPAPGKKPGLPF